MASLNEILLLIRFSGLSHTARILSHSRYRNRLNRYVQEERSSRKAAPLKAPGKLSDAYSVPGGVRLKFENAELECVLIAPNMARLTWSPGILPPPYAIDHQISPLETAQVKQHEHGWRLASKELRLTLDRAGQVSFFDPSGALLRQEGVPCHQGEPLPPAWISEAALQPGERLFGLGEQTEGLDLRGAAHQIWNNDPGGSYGIGQDPIYMPLPVYMGMHQAGSYLLFYENSYPAEFEFRAAQDQEQPDNAPDVRLRFEGGALRYYFLAGSPQRLLESFTTLTGRPAMPPIWSLGYHQSRWGYRSDADVRQVAAGFHAHEMPLSAIHLDIDYMDGYRVFTVDQARFPDLSALSEELAAKGIRLVPIIDPGVKIDPNYHVYQQGEQAGIYVKAPDGQDLKGVVWPGWCVFPDFTRPEARRWWGGYYPALLDSGMAGFWHDMNEPAAFTTGGGLTISLAGKHSLEGQEGDHLQAHNLYGLQMNRAAHEAVRKHQPERRPWIISRSGWVSQQRYAWNWMGDSESTWGSLRMTLTQTLGLGLSGQPYTGPDIGGFSGSPDAELYLRWFQAAVFLPFFRTHSSIGTARREPWVYGEPYTTILRKFLQLRYRLLPYLYTLAWQASQDGQPFVRPLFWLEQDPTRRWQAVQRETGDCFLLGDSLLIAPVLEPGAHARELFLPSGDWYSLWDDTHYPGGREVRLPVTLENIPVLVRGGSLLPLEEQGFIHLHFYSASEGLPAKTTGQLYLDEGDGYGDSRLDCFDITQTEDAFEVAWRTEGKFPFPKETIMLHLHGFSARSVSIDNQPAIPADQPLLTKPFRTARFER